MPNMPTTPSPLILGVATLDTQFFSDRELTSFGGVGKNVACALGQLGAAPRFLSPGHGPELDTRLSEHFKLSAVRWERLPLMLPMPFFEAHLGPQGEVRRERYYDNGAFAPLNPALLTSVSDQLFTGTSVLVASTDLHMRALKTLSILCQRHQVPLFLISSSRPKARRIRAIRPDILALNLAELTALFPQINPTEPETLAQAAANLVAADGACLVTLGPGGALLVLPEQQGWLLQRVPTLQPESTVGAGDNLLAALIYHRLKAQDWPETLTLATRHTLNYLGKAPDTLPALETGVFRKSQGQ